MYRTNNAMIYIFFRVGQHKINSFQRYRYIGAIFGVKSYEYEFMIILEKVQCCLVDFQR